MTEPKITSKKRGGWLRKLAWVAGILVVLLVVAYFIATSPAFLKGVILPKAGKSIGAEVTVTDAQISPFSHVRLSGLKVQPAGSEPLLTVQDIHANYNLWSIITGNIVVSEIIVESPVVTVIENADGTCNLDALTKAAVKETKPATQPAPSTPGKPLQIDIKKVALNNATVRLVKKYANGGQDTMEVTGLNFSVSDLKNGQPGTIELAAGLAVQKAAQTNAVAASLQAKLMGRFDLVLAPDLKPGSIKGTTTFTVNEATGSMADLGAFTAALNCELTPTDLKELALRLTKAGTSLAQIRMSGPFDAAKSEGKLKLEISGVDQRALNLAAASSGMDFGTTTFNCTNDIELAKNGKLISLSGNFDLAHLQVKQKGQTSPTLDLRSDYAVMVDQTAQSAVLQKLSLAGTQDSRDLLQINLSSPMTIPLGGNSNGAGDATLNMAINNLNLADWKAFAGESAPGGLFGLTMKLVSQQGGKRLGFQLDAHLDNLTTGNGDTAINQGNIQVQADGSVADMKLIRLDKYQVDVVRQGKSLAKVSGNATFDSATQDADLQILAQTALAQLMAVPNAGANDGAVNFKAHVTSKQKKIGLMGELALTPTDRAKNTLELSGSVDVAQSDAITGSFKLSADSLDVTRYYDVVSSLKPAATNALTTVASSAPASKPDQEPAPLKLPLNNFAFDLNIGHLFLHEMDIANWQTAALLNGSHIVIKPCQLAINGAPVKATTDLNLGVPGYAYDVACDASAIPLAPLVNSFAPGRKGQVKGTTTIGIMVRGAGITGASLQKNLSGQFNVTATNLDLAIENLRQPIVKGIINVIVSIPDLIKNPAATIGNWFGGSQKSSFADKLTASPIDSITMQASAGNGQVNLQSAEVRSPAFQVLAAGRINLASDLTNSTIAIPVQIRLNHSLAGQIGLVDAAAPTNAAYVALPDFLKMQGTVGKPEAKTEKLVLVELAAKTGAGLAGKIGGAAGQQIGSAINAVEGFFGGSKSTTTNSTPAATNSSTGGGLLKLFGR